MSEEKQPFTEHLSELRKRILISAVVTLVATLISFTFSEDIFKVIVFPLYSTMTFKTVYPFIELLPRENVASLVFLGPAEAFWMHMKVAMIAGVIVASPLIFYELWKFISPGLLKKEKRLAFPFVSVTTGLFLVGSLFCFAIVLPFAMKFLLTYKTQSLTPMLSVGKYVDFCLKFILAFGVIFELPVVIIFLTRMGIVTPKTLAKNRKYAVLLAFVAAAILTPTPDAFNQLLMAVPIIFLYEGGIIASKVFMRRKLEDDKREESQSHSI
jgi:sec-independent protein translocase protein TatC